jgi:hypothetical protein
MMQMLLLLTHDLPNGSARCVLVEGVSNNNQDRFLMHRSADSPLPSIVMIDDTEKLVSLNRRFMEAKVLW